jgi:aconitate hydratase
LTPGQKFEVIVNSESQEKKIEVLSRLDSEVEIAYYKHGGILNYVLRDFLKE